MLAGRAAAWPTSVISSPAGRWPESSRIRHRGAPALHLQQPGLRQLVHQALDALAQAELPAKPYGRTLLTP